MPRAPDSATRESSLRPFRNDGQRPAMPRYSNGADAIAINAPIDERFDDPARSNVAPATSASQFSASEREEDRMFGSIRTLARTGASASSGRRPDETRGIED